MDIEKQRGFLFASSLMQFDYDNKIINIRYTWTRKIFAEDTYRTLMAVDSAVMVIDGAKRDRGTDTKTF